MNRMKVAVIAGLDSSEAEISMKSATQVFEALNREMFEPYFITLKESLFRTIDGVEIDKNFFGFIDQQGEVKKFDYALIMVHGAPGENGVLQGYFEMMGVPYSGCSVEVSALTFNKSLCKKVVQFVANVNLAKEITIRRGETVNVERIIEELGLPLFVKPNASGSSCGVTKVKESEQLVAAVEMALKESEVALLEEFIEGTEVSQGVMIVGGDEWVLPATELVSKNEFFDYQAKYTDGFTQEITPARIPESVAKILNHTTLDIYKTLGCRGIVRIDYIIKKGKPYFIEVNTTPGMSRNSIVPQQWNQVGLTMEEAFTLLLRDEREMK